MDGARPSFREVAGNAIHYWERRRLIYNLVFTSVVLVQGIASGTVISRWFDVGMAFAYVVLAVVANLLYCAAHVVDVFMQLSNLRAAWLENRWMLFVTGTGFAALITYSFVSFSLFE